MVSAPGKKGDAQDKVFLVVEVCLKHVMELGRVILVEVGAGVEFPVVEPCGAAQQQPLLGNQDSSDKSSCFSWNWWT